MLNVKPKRKITPKKQHDEQCGCPVCQGLRCMERPRYFAGQLLTETELNSEQEYVRAKQRLHNRYLHGSGVVCGLQVVCSDCDGWVTIKEGYAIDPCGNDVIVCADHDFNVIDYIHQCQQDRRRRNDCTPVRTPPPQNCDEEETWCIYLTYVEQEARPVTALRNTKSSGCTCGGSCNGSCTCGNGSSKATRVSTTATRTSTALACEPTRIFETYQVGMEKQCDSCGIDWRDLLVRVPQTNDNRVSPLLQVLMGLIQNTNFDDTLLAKLTGCFQTITEFVTNRLPTSKFADLYPAAVVTPSDAYNNAPGAKPYDQYSAARQFYRAVCDLYIKNPVGVRCELASRLKEIDLPAPMTDEGTWLYASRLQTGVYDTFALLLQYLLDCICYNLLPSCPTTTYDDRVPLACVTVRDDTIVSICNFSCRQYAGAFPTLFYWLSALPIIPVISTAVRALCCAPDLVSRVPAPKPTPQPQPQPNPNQPIGVVVGVQPQAVAGDAAPQPKASFMGSDLQNMLADLDPDFTLRRSLLESDFALPKMLGGNFARSISGIFGGNPMAQARPDAVSIAPLVGQPAEVVNQTLNQANVAVVERQVDAYTLPADAKPAAAFLNAGDRVVVYRRGDQVVGFGSYDVSAELAAKDAELSGIRDQLAAMRAEIDAIKGTSASSPTTGAKTTRRKKNG